MGDPDVGTHRDLEAAAEGVPVHGRDHGHRQLLPDPADLLTTMCDPAVGEVTRVTALLAGRSAVPGHPREHREVEPGTERLALTGQHDDPHPLGGLELLAGLLDRGELGAVEGVALVGAG